MRRVFKRKGNKEKEQRPIVEPDSLAASLGGPRAVIPSASTPTVSIQKDNHGLFLLSPDDHSSECDVSYPIDIVAVHGINGTPLKTWTHENGNLWLRDLLPKDIPGSRVFSFGYDAEVFFSLGTGKIQDFARCLLEHLVGDMSRAVIFVCHSMGGLVVKQAIITALIDGSRYDDLRNSILGILFFATPHRGSTMTSFSLVMATIANVALSGGSRFTGRLRTDLIKILERDSDVLNDICTNFRNQATNFNIASFIEQKITWPAGSRVVDEASGVMNIPHELIVPMPGCDHREICRFAHRDTSGYRDILGLIQEWAKVVMNSKFELTEQDINCLHTLAFPEMDNRAIQARNAHKHTCQWILNHISYTTWVEQESGLLWVMGGPGTGKSTLMASMLQNFRHFYPSLLTFDFFFHGRGQDLQKTPIGMYRTLLHQLMMQSPSARIALTKAYQEKIIKYGSSLKWNWQVEELQMLLFNGLVEAATKCPVAIFVDALDESASEAPKLLRYFHQLNDCQSPIKICISCRYFPVLRTIPGLEVSITEENHQDIATFVHNALNSTIIRDDRTTALAEVFVEAIVEKSSHIFQWAVLVVDMVAEYINNHESLLAIHEMLSKVPEQLGEVYQHVLEKIITDRNKSKALLLFQWVCFAARPLSPEMLRHVMAADNASIDSSGHCQIDPGCLAETNDIMGGCIRSFSGGLVEVEDGKVQFIHQSAKDFLISSGLWYLTQVVRPTSSANLTSEMVIGQGHHCLGQSCLKYFIWRGMSYKWPSESRHYNGGHELCPILAYTVDSLPFHANNAELHGIPQLGLVKQMQQYPNIFRTWKQFRNQHGSLWLPHSMTTLLHFSASAGLLSAINFLLEMNIPIDARDRGGHTALHHAVFKSNFDIIHLLLSAGANINALSDIGTPVSVAAEGGNLDVVKLLIEQGADIHTSDCSNRSTSGDALQQACHRGQLLVAQLLIDHGADVNAQGRQIQPKALILAAASGHLEVAELLLDRGADVNASGGYRGNALQEAAYHRCLKVVRLLISRGADVNVQAGKWNNPLMAALSLGYRLNDEKTGQEIFKIVKFLLESGADPNSRSLNKESLFQSIRKNSGWRKEKKQAIIDLLLEYGGNDIEEIPEGS